MKLTVDLPSGSHPLPYRFLRISGTVFKQTGQAISVKIVINGSQEIAVWGMPSYHSYDGTEASYFSGFTKVIDLGSDVFERTHILTVIVQACGETLEKSSSFIAVHNRDAPKIGNFAAGTHPDFRLFGQEFLSLACEYGLQPVHNVVELGSGAGRLSVAIAAFLKGGTLKAFDVDQSAVDFCKTNIAQRFPCADFILTHEKNTIYNPLGNKTSREGAIAVPSGSKDFVYCWSVFTHFAEEDFRIYINEFARILRPGGLAMFSVFLFEPGTMNREFHHMGGGFWTSNPSKPEAAIAIERNIFEYIVKQASFQSLTILDRSDKVIGGQNIAIAIR